MKTGLTTMSIIKAKKLEIFLILCGVLVFGAVSISGLLFHQGMEMDDFGVMRGCIFNGQTMICKMSVMEHISRWQNMFVVVPQENLTLLVLLILLAVVIFETKNIPIPPRLFKNDTPTKRFYWGEHPNLLLFNPLKEAFSQGILNPKIYD